MKWLREKILKRGTNNYSHRRRISADMPKRRNIPKAIERKTQRKVTAPLYIYVIDQHGSPQYLCCSKRCPVWVVGGNASLNVCRDGTHTIMHVRSAGHHWKLYKERWQALNCQNMPILGQKTCLFLLHAPMSANCHIHEHQQTLQCRHVCCAATCVWQGNIPLASTASALRA
jgi:hypothetical protein